ncbi:MAG: hypothetical protein BZ137_04390 [Methanosphaera sp. rholeuAM130]|nr:MAG: hypothetical protein BZ137_04390 [Methanosphaera sp. rholeuAM130]
MSLISDEENCRQPKAEYQSTELSKLEQEWLNINWEKVTRNIFKIQKRITHAEEQKDYRRA